MTEITRTPIIRTAITVASDNGVSFGKWFPFPIDPDKEKPRLRRNVSGEVLWCPYCNDWTVFKKNYNSTQEGLICTGACGWANTNDFYVRTYNKLWNGGK